MRERSYETAKNSTVEKNSSKGSKLSTGKQNTPTSFHNNQSKPIQQMQGAHTTRQELTGRTSMTSLYAWGCTDLILEEYRKKGITQMFEWQAECLQSIAQVSETQRLRKYLKTIHCFINFRMRVEIATWYIMHQLQLAKHLLVRF